MALTEDDVRSMKVTELRAKCDELGIEKKGLKVGHMRVRGCVGGFGVGVGVCTRRLGEH